MKIEFLSVCLLGGIFPGRTSHYSQGIHLINSVLEEDKKAKPRAEFRPGLWLSAHRPEKPVKIQAEFGVMGLAPHAYKALALASTALASSLRLLEPPTS